MATETTPLNQAIETAFQAAPGSAAADGPLWYKDAIIYEVHVKSFFDTNNDGIGDFRGLTEKLDYLQSLGITCLWVLPFFPSPLRDDGYDISDYLSVHPSYGTLDDFKIFVDAAHARGIKVLIELVVNHTSDQHPWFQRARHAPKGSPDREFYVWSDTDKTFPETRIIFVDTEKSNWAYDPVANQYYWHRFFSHQPDLNHNNPAVVEAVIGVMKFWLDMGVDALRLDAVPYLCVREGTSNENLPETHAVLKRMRRALDEAYSDRMLLAEANQWPSDVRPYFGDGDECHMAFHFPLMPRIFMALRQEDRHAITEILNQTPEIPDSSQWALFLRNHDELTLEMVTDEERDYMYSVYAADPQMRLNLGIRRRLAPLVENSRRRIELLNSLLFSLPGTPIIYYGDEIGMGDNVYLGDRNGVRTPMQWSSDRNGGFSRADTARLYAPPIQDPVYGFQAINVEAQERYPFSPLNWMKRLISMRKQHRVFGRGSLEFVGCANRKVFAYLRRDDREKILCVVNLSRAVQPAELDLRAFEGLIPIEMSGVTEFPRIGPNPYFLALGPYASYWFILEAEPLHMSARPVEQLETVTGTTDSLLVGVDWQNVFDGGTRTILEKNALIPFLQRQRWFASKSRDVRQARFTDWTLLTRGTTPAFLTIASLEYTDGWNESYFVPLALVDHDRARRALADTPGAVLARITGARKGAIVDAMFDDEACGSLLRLIASSVDLATTRGSVKGNAAQWDTPWSEPAGWPTLGPDLAWTRANLDQSNSLAFVTSRSTDRDSSPATVEREASSSTRPAADRSAERQDLVLKVFRRIEPAINPEYEINRYLSDRGFARSPRLAGALEYLRPTLDPGTLAIAQQAVGHQGSAWDFTIDELRRFYERVGSRPVVPQDPLNGSAANGPFFRALAAYYLQNAELLGRRTAELHTVLAQGRDDAFVPVRLDSGRLAASADAMLDHAKKTLDSLNRRLPQVPDPFRSHAEAVIARSGALLSRLDSVRHADNAGFAIRIHGDYHLGQVLRVEEDFVILDFEGEPARPIAERRTKHSPLKDVAGMIRSFGYAAYAALFAFTTHAPDEYAALEFWADTWQEAAARSFANGYLATLAADDAVRLVGGGEAWPRLLDAFLLDKALYEVGYELNHRPDWVRIPLLGIRKLIG